MPSDHPGFYIGLISGTSADGIDAALIEINDSDIALVETHTGKYAHEHQSAIKRLMLDGSAAEIEILMSLDTALGIAFADAALDLLEKADVSPSLVKAVGSHGQTIRHYPGQAYPALGNTLQVGDPNIIHQRTQIPVIADLRRADMALGGQGAPLMPKFHKAMFNKPGTVRAIVNIGGIANITMLDNHGVSGFDTGPGNTLMDAWYAKHRDGHYDNDGSWAHTGEPNLSLLEHLLTDPWFVKPPPKSTGQDYFNLEWLEAHCTGNSEFEQIAPEDMQATLLLLTARPITERITQNSTDETYICGGGANNSTLMKALEDELSTEILSTSSLGMDSDWIEAAGFGWLAWCHLAGKPGNVPAVTGASDECVLGARWG